jgi:hypothetical protein
MEHNYKLVPQKHKQYKISTSKFSGTNFSTRKNIECVLFHFLVLTICTNYNSVRTGA